MVAESMNSSIAGRSRDGDPEHGLSGGFNRREIGDHRAQRLLRRHQTQRHLGDHAQCAFAADEQLGQAQSGNVFEPGTAQSDRGAVGQHHLHAEHVVGGDAVFHAAQAAGVGRDVAADAADLVRRRVGRIPQAVLGDGLLDLGVEQPGLADRGAGDRDRRRCRASSPSTARSRRPPRWRHRTGRCPYRGSPPESGWRWPTAGRSEPLRSAAARTTATGFPADGSKARSCR